jgi:hypothetical protein
LGIPPAENLKSRASVVLVMAGSRFFDAFCVLRPWDPAGSMIKLATGKSIKKRYQQSNNGLSPGPCAAAVTRRKKTSKKPVNFSGHRAKIGP